MGCAPMAHVLWGSVMNYNPSNPKWVRRRHTQHRPPLLRHTMRSRATHAVVLQFRA